MSIITQDIIIINFSSVFCIIKKKKKSYDIVSILSTC